MLNSIFLENYAPLIIPFNTVCGILLSEKGIIYNNIDLIGIFLLLTGFLLFFDRLYKSSLTGTKKIMLPVSLFLVLGSYLSIVVISIYKYEKTKLFFYLLFTAFFLTLGWVITDDSISSTNTQYVFFSILGICGTLLYLIPKYRDSGEVFTYSLPLLTVFFTILVFSTISTPILTTLKKKYLKCLPVKKQFPISRVR